MAHSQPHGYRTEGLDARYTLQMPQVLVDCSVPGFIERQHQIFALDHAKLQVHEVPDSVEHEHSDNQDGNREGDAER